MGTARLARPLGQGGDICYKFELCTFIFTFYIKSIVMFLPPVGKGSLDNVVYHEIALPCEYGLSTNLSDYDDSIVTQRMKLFDFFAGNTDTVKVHVHSICNYVCEIHDMPVNQRQITHECYQRSWTIPVPSHCGNCVGNNPLATAVDQ